MRALVNIILSVNKNSEDAVMYAYEYMFRMISVTALCMLPLCIHALFNINLSVNKT
jgi:hypothetical protein